MSEKNVGGLWESIARIILNNRILIIISLILATYFFSTHWHKIRFTYTEANLLPNTHEENLKYNSFTSKFGEEGNLIVIGVKDSLLFTLENLNAWNKLSNSFKDLPQVETVIAFGDLQKLIKDKDKRQFYVEPFIEDSISSNAELKSLIDELFFKSPFYDKFLINTETKSVRTAINLKTSIVNTVKREEFINRVLLPRVNAFEKAHNIDIRISGMPYVRTKYSETIKAELGKFVILAIFVTSLIFYFFFRSLTATVISICTVCIGVMWTLGIIGILEYELTVLTAVIPPLIIVIGMPNCIYLIKKYQHEVNTHGDKSLSLQKVITKIGNATLMTNVTTASGFATFIITNSQLLKEFGTVASLSILSIFIICILVIPIIYSFLPIPGDKHLEHLNKKWIVSLFDWMALTVKTKKIEIYTISIILLAVSIIGIYKIEISGSLIDDLPKDTEFFEDIMFYEKEFNGILPLEIYIDTKRKKAVTKLSTIKKMKVLEDIISEIPELSRPISIVSLVKYSKQAYYNGNPKYYQVPTTQENSFILSYAKNSTSGTDGIDLIKNFVDSTGQYTRIATFMKDIKIERMERIEEKLYYEISKIMPKDRYEVYLTGKAYLFQQGTYFLVKNLILSLSLAIVLISIFMAYMFRNFRMIIISLIPNLLPLLITAGLMGFIGVPIKPSTILIFSIAFGISVDDTIHFLAKYRQELQDNKWQIKKSVYNSIKETGISMFYTSVVLFFGFSVFIISNFGGTVALGALVSATLLLAMLSNLLLLPSMLLSLERSVANEKVLKKPKIKILTDEKELLN
ncbi:MAG: efflux RND transporter permease subunit [Flavobacteriaceae bacterium]|jgi:predicted RND superfamily exporter protein